jgi:hypothetical protein
VRPLTADEASRLLPLVPGARPCHGAFWKWACRGQIARVPGPFPGLPTMMRPTHHVALGRQPEVVAGHTGFAMWLTKPARAGFAP